MGFVSVLKRLNLFDAFGPITHEQRSCMCSFLLHALNNLKIHLSSRFKKTGGSSSDKGGGGDNLPDQPSGTPTNSGLRKPMIDH